jgi:hypothetical protein
MEKLIENRIKQELWSINSSFYRFWFGRGSEKSSQRRFNEVVPTLQPRCVPDKNLVSKSIDKSQAQAFRETVVSRVVLYHWINCIIIQESVSVLLSDIFFSLYIQLLLSLLRIIFQYQNWPTKFLYKSFTFIIHSEITSLIFKFPVFTQYSVILSWPAI